MDTMRDRGKALTVLGPVSPDKLGVTLTHEHIFIDGRKYFRKPDDPMAAIELTGPVTAEMRGYLQYYDYWHADNLILDDYATALSELRRFHSRGGRTICDVSSRGIRIDRLLPDLPRLSAALGLHIIVGTGCYISSQHEAFIKDTSVKELASLFIREVDEGIGDTGIRAGILGEIGLSNPPDGAELRVLEATADAHRATGAPIMIHQSDFREYRIPHMALDLLEQWGVALDRVVIAHSGFGTDVEPLAAAAARGAYISFDHFGMPGYERDLDWQLPQELDYVKRVMALVKSGYAERVLVSHDVCAKTHLRTYGGHGYAHILALVRTMFARAGMTDDQYHTIMQSNPARLLPLS